MTYSPEADRRNAALSLAATFLAATMAVVVFVPSDGRILAPLHAATTQLFGQATFLIPLGLLLGGAIGLVKRVRPAEPIPRRRLAGLAIVTIALLPGEALLGQSTGLVGDWFTGFLVQVLGTPLTVVMILVLLAFGSALLFDPRHVRLRFAAR